jgi:hypothetical protein
MIKLLASPLDFSPEDDGMLWNDLDSKGNNNQEKPNDYSKNPSPETATS